MEQVRVRYAPSPTGYPHVGNIRTALFNWVFARHHNGKFILRIEDTDVARKVEGAVEIIMESLRWLGLDWDEGPYFQSQRLSLYQETAERLVQQGYAYYCFCTPERLEQMRQEQTRKKQPTGYDRHCRNLSNSEINRLRQQGITPVIRFKTPMEGQTAFDDLIRGTIIFENSTLDDFVILKSDGYPTYHLANIVDDHYMNITHVMRAEEWVSSTPKHCLLYQSLGWEPPLFAHLPMILGPDRSKLSKRHGATAVNEYRDEGFLAEALFNFLALLGWSLDDKTEIMSVKDIVTNFSLERVSKTAAIFNKEKLEWMNGVYIRSLSVSEFATRVKPFLEKYLPPAVKRPLDDEYILKILPLIQERARTLKEVPELTDFFFVDTPDYDTGTLLGKLEKTQGYELLRTVLAKLREVDSWRTEILENNIRPLCASFNLKPAVLFGMIRVAITGRTVSPPLFQTMEVLGRERCFHRLELALQKLQ